MPTYAEIMKRVNDNPDLLRINTKYSAKLTEDERHAVLAAWMAGYQKPLLAAAFGINRATVSYIVRKESPHYKNIRKLAFELGRERYIEEKLTPIVMERLEEAKSAAQVVLSEQELREKKSADVTKPNPKATSRAGRYSFVDEYGTLLVEVRWYGETLPPDPADPHYEGDREPGWYLYIDPASPQYERGKWGTAPQPYGFNQDRFTSKTAFDAFIANTGMELQE